MIDVIQFREKLFAWFKKYQRDLPWRKTKNPYFIWVSEVMLQQTQVKQVLEYYQKFISQFPDINTLSQADLQHVLKAWEGMGYYSRARNLHQAAKRIMNDFQGHIPSDYTTFRKLPGIGDYIAAAVLSQAFDAPHPVVDGNVKRVLSRIYLIDLPINSSGAVKLFIERANTLMDRQQPGCFNQAIMELGAIICRPQKPSCENCPVSSFCQAFVNNQQQQFPIVAKAKDIPEYHILVGLVYKNDHILIVQRDTSGLLGGMWEFPGGRIFNGETTGKACIKKIKAKVNISVKIDNYLTRIKHTYSHFKIIVDVFRCTYLSGDLVLNGHMDYRWIQIDELDQFPLHKASLKILRSIKLPNKTS